MAVTNTILLDAYASMSADAYLNNASVPDVVTALGTYEEIANQIDGPRGFQARAYFNSTNNELVVAFTGTEGFSDGSLSEFLPDVGADWDLARFGVTVQSFYAAQFIDAAIKAADAVTSQPYTVTYTGQSLGGFLAQVASVNKTPGEVVVFNSPGVGGLFIPASLLPSFGADSYTYIYSNPNTVRRQDIWHQCQLKLRESSAHLVGLIMRRVVCDASVGFRVSFV